MEGLKFKLYNLVLIEIGFFGKCVVLQIPKMELRIVEIESIGPGLKLIA